MANSFQGCDLVFTSLVCKKTIKKKCFTWRLFSIGGLMASTFWIRSFGTEGRRKDGPQVLPDNRVFNYVNFRGSDIKFGIELQVLSSESQPEKVTSDLPEDPAIIKAIFLHSSSASSITPQATTISRPNGSSLGLPNLAVHQTLSSYQPTQNSTSFSSLLSTNTLAAGQPMLLHGQEFGRKLLAGLPPGLAAYHIKQPMQHPVTNPLTRSPPVIMDSLTSTPMLIPSDLPSGPDLLSSRITSMSSAAKCSSTAGLNIDPMPQVIHGANFVIKSFTSESLLREPTGAGAPILPLPKPYATKGNLQNPNSIASKSAERGKRYPNNYKMRISNVQNPRDAVSKSCFLITNTKPWERENRKKKAESRKTQNTSNSGRRKKHHQTSKSISAGRGKKIPHLAAKYAEDFDFVAMNKKFNKDEVWGELGNHSKADLKTEADASDPPAEDAEDVDAAMKSDKKPGYVKHYFWPWKPKISEQRKLDMETFGYYQVHQRSHGSRTLRLGGNPKVYSNGRENGNARRGWAHPTWSHVT
ncbi:hypothetical protein ACJRO7_009872 [Eucalyptus globulus]|uniref:DFDF domain-containing protein n=1 Tax=Eucalyptus globulus TaxID=34317 RepID=A0ABD3LDR2_EUCGL